MSAASTVHTPIGPFTVLVDAEGAVLASGWTADLGALLPLVAPALRPAEPEHRRELGSVTDAVIAYHRGELSAADGVEVRQACGPFLQQAWQVLRAVPAGTWVSYSELAAKAGRPAAVRAAATACARNAAALFVPCHRVLRSDGSLGGYRWGLAVKRRLLAHESSARPHGCR